MSDRDRKSWRAAALALLLLALAASSGRANPGPEVQERIDADLAAGKPIVVHVVVALCDNRNQNIVPVAKGLGDGQNPETNLYWGALYGVRTHLQRTGDWTRLDTAPPPFRPILERVVFRAELPRGSGTVPVYIVADAWDGAHIRGALREYLQLIAGASAETVEVADGPETLRLPAGGAAHLIAFVGHNGMMDHPFGIPRPPEEGASARSAVALACSSKPYFLSYIRDGGAQPLVLTTGLMAPEAYTLDAVVRAWVGEGGGKATLEAAAVAYDRYQKCGLKSARWLFWGAER